MLLYIFIFVYLVGLSTIYTYFEEKKDEIKLLTIPTFILFGCILNPGHGKKFQPRISIFICKKTNIQYN